MSAAARIDFNDPNVLGALIRILPLLQRMGIDTHELQLHFLNTTATDQKRHELWLHAMLQLCFRQIQLQQNNEWADKKAQQEWMAIRVAHQLANAAFWLMIARAFTAQAKAEEVSFAKSTPVVDPAIQVALLKRISDAFSAVQAALSKQFSDNQTALDNALSGLVNDGVLSEGQKEKIDSAQTTASLLDITDTAKQTEPERRKKLVQFAQKDLGPVVVDNRFLGKRFDVLLDVQLISVLRELGLTPGQASRLLDKVRNGLLDAAAENAKLRQEMSAIFDHLEQFEALLDDKLSTTNRDLVLNRFKPVLPSKPLRTDPRLAHGNNPAEELDEDEETLKNKGVKLTPSQQMLRRAKYPHLSTRLS